MIDSLVPWWLSVSWPIITEQTMEKTVPNELTHVNINPELIDSGAG